MQTDTPSADTATDLPNDITGDTPSFLTSVLEEVRNAGADAPEIKQDPPEPEKKPEGEAKPETEEEDPKDLSKGAGEKWKKLKAAEKAAKQRATELEAKYNETSTKLTEYESRMKELEASATQVAEVDRLKGVMAEMESELAISRVEATPEYKRTVVEPMARLIGVAERLAKRYDTEGKGHLKERLLGIIETKDIDSQREKMEDLTSEWRESDRFDLYRLGDDYQVIQGRREEIQGNAKDALAQIEARQREETEQSKAENTRTWQRSVTEVADTLKAAIPGLSEERFKQIQGQVAANNFDAEKPQGKAFAAYSAVLLPEVLKQVKTLMASNTALEAKIKSLQGSKPGAGEGKQEDIKEDPTDDGGGFLSRVSKQLPG